MELLAGLQGIYRDLAVIGGEILLLLGGFVATMLLARLVFRWLGSVPALENHRPRLVRLQRLVRAVLLLMLLILCLAVGGFNGYLISQKVDVFAYTRGWIAKIPPDFWPQLGLGLAKIFALVVSACFVLHWLRRLMGMLEARAKGYEQVQANDESITAFFASLTRILGNVTWLGVFILSAGFLDLPGPVVGVLWIILRIYLIVAIGLLVVKTVAAVVESLDALSKKYWYRENYLGWYERLSTLVPLLRRCLEYVIYVFVATGVLLQVEFIAHLATIGPRVVKAIGIVFLSKVVVAICNLLVDRALGPREDLEEAERKRRLTVNPIFKSLLEYGVYFIAFVLILKAFDLNPLPILAGAGIVGVVVGLGAQPLINDIVSGFFVLFENLFLVGDYVETGEARGTVEAIHMRTTRIRDPDGQVHILRNGQLGSVINYSKDYTHAVVEVGVAYESDLDRVYRVLAETGQRLMAENEFVLSPTEVKGLKEFGESELLIRTVTRVKPGHHRDVAFQLRKMIKEDFDRAGIEIPFARRVLIFRNEASQDTAAADSAQPLPGLGVQAGSAKGKD
ncbi:hypothetical protein DESUT3_08380 [Desulfuromonas versatilis]|uniref:MscS Mechanosensitive ion channel n=1 Tax=Desulfuromonas versatilis TaxID=2802975 RepID=A0ABM8HMY0_9BACT|nr:mechanosensitive ion channel family protein [Desulfuromonas versatilis]BCR03769.1 hypothetical protein DESUT3_08380 [Desulfuromonas versatilis]